MLDIQSADYTLLEGTPALHMVIDGKDAYVADVRMPLLEAGFVYLISLTPDFQWEDELPARTIPPTPGLCVEPFPFAGLTDDPEVLRLTHDFLARLDGSAGRPFEVGPVE